MKMQIVSFHCVLKNKFGQILSSTFNQDILTGPQHPQQELAALSNAMSDLKLGEKRLVALSAVDAYGFYDPKMVLTMPRAGLPELQESRKNANPIFLNYEGKRHQFRVVGMTSEDVTLDGNHPFAGQDLVFEIDAVAVREATAKEISDSTEATPHSGPVLH